MRYRILAVLAGVGVMLLQLAACAAGGAAGGGGVEGSTTEGFPRRWTGMSVEGRLLVADEDFLKHAGLEAATPEPHIEVIDNLTMGFFIQQGSSESGLVMIAPLRMIMPLPGRGTYVFPGWLSVDLEARETAGHQLAVTLQGLDAWAKRRPGALQGKLVIPVRTPCQIAVPVGWALAIVGMRLEVAEGVSRPVVVLLRPRGFSERGGGVGGGFGGAGYDRPASVRADGR